METENKKPYSSIFKKRKDSVGWERMKADMYTWRKKNLVAYKEYQRLYQQEYRKTPQYIQWLKNHRAKKRGEKNAEKQNEYQVQE